MTGADVALLAGTISTVLFASSTLPMMVKAIRTRDLASYSLANLVLANIGNAVYCIYVVHLPVGPIWALHGFYVVTTGLMLLWCLRYRHVQPRDALSTERRLA
jgi:uncharacterized protein with PQ loop repeat